MFFRRPKLSFSYLRYVLTPCLCCSDLSCVIKARVRFLKSARNSSAGSGQASESFENVRSQT